MNIFGDGQTVSNIGASSEVGTSKPEENKASKSLLGKRVREGVSDQKKLIPLKKDRTDFETPLCAKDVVNVVSEEEEDFYYSKAEEEAFGFVQEQASQDAEHSLSDFDEYFDFNSDRFPNYGSGLVFLYAALHRHGQDDDKFAMDKFYPAIVELQSIKDAAMESAKETEFFEEIAGEESNKKAESIAKKLIENVRATRLASASDIDHAIRKLLDSDTEQVIEAFRKDHYYANGEFKYSNNN